MPAHSPPQNVSADTTPRLSELLEGPRHLAQYAKQFSTVCREHGTDYCRVCPDHKPPQSLRGVAVQDLHKFLCLNSYVIGFDGQKRVLDPFPLCCQEAVAQWLQHRE